MQEIVELISCLRIAVRIRDGYGELFVAEERYCLFHFNAVAVENTELLCLNSYSQFEDRLRINLFFVFEEVLSSPVKEIEKFIRTDLPP